MSTATATLPRRAAGGSARPGLGRLTAVELRKMRDTRAGFWLLLSVAGLTLAVVILSCLLGHADHRTFANLLSNALQPVSILLPVIGILLVASEWSQRTALITFALVPHRGRVLAAKILASLALTVVAVLVALALAAAGTAFGGSEADDVWTMSLGLLGQSLLYVGLGMLVGVAFGAIIQAPAPAIVLFFVLPTAFLALGSIGALHAIAPWVDQARAFDPLTNHLLDGKEWARVATAAGLWVVLPLLAGLARFTRSDIT